MTMARDESSSSPVDADALADENRRLNRLRFLVSLTAAELMQADLTLDEAQAVVERMRAAAMALFPGSEAQFDLIYRTRFARIIRDRFGAVAGEPVH